MRGHDLDRKSQDKVTLNARTNCKQLGQYRMPFAWTAINVIDLIAGSQSSGGAGGHTTVIGSDSPRDRKDSSTGNRRDSSSSQSSGGTQERRATTSSSSSSEVTKRRSMSQNTRIVVDEAVSDDPVNIKQDFSPVTLTLNVFFRQVLISGWSLVSGWSLM